MPDALTNFMANNYGNDYYVADVDRHDDGNSNGLDLEEIDEIDTKNMKIYQPVKKERRAGVASKEPVKAEQQETSIGDSLLIPSKTIAGSTQEEIDTDLMLNALSEQAAGTSASMQTPSIAQPNTMFDESSQVSSKNFSGDIQDNQNFLFSSRPTIFSRMITLVSRKPVNQARLKT